MKTTALLLLALTATVLADDCACVPGSITCSDDCSALLQCDGAGGWQALPCGEDSQCLVFNENGVKFASCVAGSTYDQILGDLKSRAEGALKSGHC